LITYATQKYGQEKVAQIVTFGTMAARAAIRDAGRALGMPLGDVDRVAKLVPGGVKVTIASALEESAELRQVYESEDYLRELIDKARALEGLARHASTHAAGVVIADQPLTAYVPLALAPRGEGQVTQYSMEALESIGLLKIDFLGLSTLTVIDRCLKHIKATQGIQITPAEIPLDDPATFALLSSAEVTGVFQVESSGMRKTLREMQPTVFEDIVVLNSLYRPGPMQYIANYIARKYGREEVTYHHPAMEPILKDTYGIIVYQEQIIRMVTDLAGYSAAEADLMRRAVGKKKAKDLAEQRAKFVAGAVERGIPQDAANAIMSDIEFFANYGFNKAHSAAYSVITCQTAYLKAHYPVEYMAALLSVERGNVEKVAALIADCRRLGIPVLPPDVNHSGLDFTIEPVGQAVGRPVGRALQPAEPVGQASSPAKPVGQPVGQAVGRAFQPAEPTPEQASVVDAAGWKARPTGMAIRFGMAAIKNVGEGPVEIILQARGDRPFAGAGDFCQRVDLRQVNKRVLECLVKCGVFDCLAPRGQLLAALDHMVATSQEAHAAREAGQLSLFGGLGGGQQPAMSFLTLPEVPPVPRKDQLAWEKELLGLYVSQNPLNLLPLNLEHVTRTDQVDETIKGRRIQIMGLVASVRTIYTKKGDPMAFVQVEDLAGAVEVVVFPRTYEETRDLWAEDRLVVVKGKADVREGRASVICDAAREYDPVIDGQAGEPAPQWGGQARTAAPQARQARTLAPRSGDGEEPPIPPPGFEPGPARRNVRRLPSCLSVTFQRSGDDERDARRLGEVYRLLTATPGDVPFCFYVPSVRGRVQLEFPNAMTCYSETLRDELLARFGGDLLAVEWAS
ncbi:MAG TPA: DNA polymerase III subunit alpha, partial [Anaerolineae bacterium]|nr:DNA polymerase III subunit alpha [Anaerolineae bacterium]